MLDALFRFEILKHLAGMKNPILLLFAGLLTMVGSGLAQARKDSLPTDSGTRIFTKVDKPAEFPGGAEGWRSYLEQNLNYPKKAQRQKIEGMVKVQFLVDKEGNISEVAAVNDPGGGLAEEATRIIAKGPKWIPAEQNGKKVIYRHIQAITFRLE
jgi:protein TonB